jgi:hypothetical protein
MGGAAFYNSKIIKKNTKGKYRGLYNESFMLGGARRRKG